jgi:exodeoxyribonuclease V gamma subunit
MLRLHFGNHLESLTALLVAQLGTGARSMFEMDEVVIPSAAVRRHLTLALAEQHGLCAQVRFGWLAQWLWQQMGRVLPDVPAQSPLATPLLAWRVLAAFGEPSFIDGHPRLAGYLAQADPVMRFELALQVAGLFDQYLTYRPEWLERWREARVVAPGFSDDDTTARVDEAWQSALWRRLLDELGSAHSPPTQRFMQALQDDPAHRLRLPRRVHVFALPTMPPAHLELLQLIAGRVDVEVYLLNPCREYWFDVVDQRRLAALGARGQAEHLEVGHRLLANWGRQTRSHLGLLVEAAGDGVIDDAHFDEPAGDSLLARLQASILDLQEPAPGSLRMAGDDRSLEIHVCHSLTRELEVLQDRLLGLFAADPALRPSQVLVVTPDLESAAPLIDAVFGATSDERRVPYTITGLARSGVNSAARVMLELLALVLSRCPVSRVFGLLEQPPVARRFGLDPAALQQVHGWLLRAGVHWALDASHREALGLPATARHSVEDGLERLMLGYALPAASTPFSSEPFAGLLPAGEAAGSQAAALGGLWSFVQALIELRRVWSLPQPASAWPGLLSTAVAQFIEADSDGLDDLQELSEAIEALATQFERSRFHDRLSVDVVQAALTRQLDDPPHGGVPTGSVTFSSMTSLRQLPYAVVCVLGLDDGKFPSSERPAEFDLMSLQPRDSDRQRRHDERNLFLDLLLAARHTLHLSYRGRSVRDNAVLPPSVLLSELIDLCVPALADDPDDPASLRRAQERLVIEHPLQPFAEVLFRPDADPRLRSFHAEYARALQQPTMSLPASSADGDLDDEADDPPDRDPALPFFRLPLAAPGPEWQQLSLERLIEFFRLPCRFLLRHRLGIDLRRPDEQLQDDEPFVPGLPERRALAERLLPALLAGQGLDQVRRLALAGHDHPAGAFGAVQLDQELPRLAAYAEQWRELSAEPVLPPIAAQLDLELDGQPWQLEIAWADLRPSGLLRLRYDEHRAGDMLAAWLQHLALCALAPPGVALRTTLLARDGVFRLASCADARQRLTELLAIYRRGLSQPLYFFPRSAWAYLSDGENLDKARAAWRVTPQRPHGESADPACRLALRGWADPFGAGLAEFADCANAVFGPLLEHLEAPPAAAVP